MVQTLPYDEGMRLLLTPNRSLSWRGNVVLWIGIAAVSLGVGVGMALAGAWLVLPFAGLEVAALGAGFYYTSRYCSRQEVITLSDRELWLEKGIFQKEAEWKMPRQSVRLLITAALHPWEPPQVYLRHGSEEVRIAPFLNRDDAERLVSILQRQGLTIQRQPRPEPYWF